MTLEAACSTLRRASLALCFAGCARGSVAETMRPAASTTAERPPGAPEPGGCRNETVDAPCAFASLAPVDPSTGAPAPWSPFASAEQTIAVSYRLAPGAATSEARLYVRARRGDEAALTAFYAAHSAARCAGVVLRAPCPPGVHVTPAVPPPPVGQLVRGP